MCDNVIMLTKLPDAGMKFEYLQYSDDRKKNNNYTAVKCNIKFAAFVDSPKACEGGRSIRLTLARYVGLMYKLTSNDELDEENCHQFRGVIDRTVNNE